MEAPTAYVLETFVCVCNFLHQGWPLTNILMIVSALVLGVLGLVTTFAPDWVLGSLGAPVVPALLLLTQVLGALYVGFAGLNWMARENLIGGIDPPGPRPPGCAGPHRRRGAARRVRRGRPRRGGSGSVRQRRGPSASHVRPSSGCCGCSRSSILRSRCYSVPSCSAIP